MMLLDYFDIALCIKTVTVHSYVALTTIIILKANHLLILNLFCLHGMILLINLNTILYLTTSCVLFWFGSRNHSKQK